MMKIFESKADIWKPDAPTVGYVLRLVYIEETMVLYVEEAIGIEMETSEKYFGKNSYFVPDQGCEII